MDLKTIIVRISLAALFGAIIGLEREYRNKNAGFRTMILISLGSALITILSLEIYDDYSDSDPTRIMSTIVSGIGFLGAGVIMKDGVSVRGITTAATIWLVAAIGMGVGAGFIEISSIALVLALIALLILPSIEHVIDRLNEFHAYNIIVSDPDFMSNIKDIFQSNKIQVIKSKQSKTTDHYRYELSAYGKPVNHENVSNILIDAEQVVSFEN